MNAAVLMMTACLAGPGQVPAQMPAYQGPMPGYQQAPVVVYPGQPYQGGYAGGYAGGCGACGFGGGGGCCGHASVDCCDKGDCCLLHKIKEKICCVHIHITCEKSCCDKGPVCPKPCAPVCQPCPKPCPPPCPPKPVCAKPCPPPCPPKPVCQPCPKPVVCCPKPVCEKPTCCKVEPVCHPSCNTCCWTPGYCLHKCKEKLCGMCDFGGCHGGCGTAATPNACGSSVIAPAPGMMVPPPAAAPVTPPTTAPKAMPNPSKVGSAYNPVTPDLSPVSGTAPRVIDLTPSRF